MITVLNKHRDECGGRTWVMERGNVVQTYRVIIHLTPYQVRDCRYAAACILRRARFEMQLAVRKAGIR